LTSDPIYNYQGYVGKAKVNLLYLIQGKEGEVKEWFTEKEARFLKQGAQPKCNRNGKYDRNYIMDCIAEYFGKTTDELVDHVEMLARLEDRIEILEKGVQRC
jgi:hypothetical protein